MEEIMKKLGLFIALICFVFSSFGQTINMKNQNRDYHEDSGVAGDSVLGIAQTEWTIRVLRDDLYRYNIYVTIDTVVGLSNNMTISFWGRENDQMDWQYIGDSVTWYMNNADTTVRFNNVTNNAVTTIAQYTATTAAFDIWAMDSILYDDTLHVPQQTQTVAAQTLTQAEQRVTWGWLRIKAHCTGATGKGVLERIDVAILEDD
jgi:hypothetical protein